MTNSLVGDVYAKIIEDVVNGSRTDFEEQGVGQDTLQELQRGWQVKLSGRGVAQMPWDPKPEPVAPAHPTNTANGLPSASYNNYDAPSSTSAQNGSRVKTESGDQHQYNGMPNGYQQTAPPSQGGAARAQQLLQAQYGAAANASLNAMQRGGSGGLALPGQQQARPQGLQLPGQSQQQAQQQYTMQQQQAAMQQRQQIQQQQQQQQPRIKVETESPQLAQGTFQQPNYTQTDGADDALGQWKEMLAQRRAVTAEQRQVADHMIRDHIMQSAADLESGLMLPLKELPSRKRKQGIPTAASSSRPTATSSSAIPQLDGDADDEDEKPDIKDEDDENAINSDLDDDDEEGIIGDDDDGEEIDSILCTYDKVQRVKNKWKCTLKDGVMSVGGKEWVFHKGTGEFEW